MDSAVVLRTTRPRIVLLHQALSGRIRPDFQQPSRLAAIRTAAVNAGLVTLYWSIGTRIRMDLLKEKRAGYGERIIPALGRRLTAEFGAGFGPRSLFYMTRTAECFPDPRIVNALRSQLSWSHFRRILALPDPLRREFYAEMCRLERWSTRTGVACPT